MVFCKISICTILVVCFLLCCCRAQLVFHEDSTAPAKECGYHIIFPSNGSNTKYTIERNYLTNKKVLNCNGTVSEELGLMFKPGDESLKIREDLRRSLGNVCSAFVEVISAVAFHSLAYKERICADGIFSEQSLNADFCDRISKLGDERKTAISSTIEGFGSHFKSAATEVVALGNLGSSCDEKCGSGSSKILCNAFYSLATVFSEEYPNVLAGSKKDSAASAPTPTAPAMKPTVDLRPFIAHLLHPILSLTKDEHLYLLHSDSTYRSMVLKEKLSAESFQEVGKILHTPSLMHLLKMFWVVRVAGDELRHRTNDDFVFYAHGDDYVLHAVSQSAREDLEGVEGLGSVMKDVQTYRDILFSESSKTTGISTTWSPPLRTELPKDTVPEQYFQMAISLFLPPILSLSKEDHTILMHSSEDRAYRAKFISERLPDLGDREVSEMANLPDLVRLLRMIWVVRVAGSELRTRSSEDFAYYAKNPEMVMHAVSASAKNDLGDLGSHLGTVMKDVSMYRDDLFPPSSSLTTLSPSLRTEPPTNGSRKEYIQLSISMFLIPILTLSKADHSILMHIGDDVPYKLRFLSQRLQDTNDSKLSEIANHPDFLRLLRMIWVERVAGSQLPRMVKSDNLLEYVSKSAQDDLRNELSSNLEAALNDFCTFRASLTRPATELITTPATEPPTTATSSGIVSPRPTIIGIMLPHPHHTISVSGVGVLTLAAVILQK